MKKEQNIRNEYSLERPYPRRKQRNTTRLTLMQEIVLKIQQKHQHHTMKDPGRREKRGADEKKEEKISGSLIWGSWE